MLGEDGPSFGGSPGPGQIDPTQPLLSLVQQLRTLTSATFDDPEEFIDEIVDELLDLPPEQRFEHGAELLEEYAVDEFGSLDAAQANFQVASALLFTVLEQVLNQWKQELAADALHADHHERNDLLIVLGAVDIIQSSMDAIQAGLQSENEQFETLELTAQERTQLVSTLVSMYARLYRERKREKKEKRPSFDALAEDVVYAEKNLSDVLAPDVEYPVVDELSDKKIAWSAIRRGALRVYLERDISVGRGAELAGMTQEQFVQFLEENGIEPDYGPDSVEELHSGPAL